MNAERQIREVVAADLEALQLLYSSVRSAASWLPAEARAVSDFARDSDGERVLVSIGSDGQIEGFISVWEPDAFIHHLYVRPQSRRQGVAKALLASPLHRVPLPWQLKCLRANTEAMRFYESAGWVEVGAGEGPEGAHALLQLRARPFDPISVKLVAASFDEAATVMHIMRLAFEEYRDRLHPPSGALRETIDHVRAGIQSGGAFLAFAGDLPVGSARYRVYPGYVYGERIAVLPAHRSKGIASALTKAIEMSAGARKVSEVRVKVRGSLPSNLAFYEKLGYRVLGSNPYPTGTDVEITLGKGVLSGETG